jgi:hypothetical protein
MSAEVKVAERVAHLTPPIATADVTPLWLSRHRVAAAPQASHDSVRLDVPGGTYDRSVCKHDEGVCSHLHKYRALYSGGEGEEDPAVRL